MLRRLRGVVALATLVWAETGHAAGESKYNVLFIAVDDLKPTIGAYGDPVAVTPHMDDILSRGLRLDNMHSQKPECAPSRISMITGKRNDALLMYGFSEEFRSGGNQNMPTLPSILREHGYRTEAVGKILDNRNFIHVNVPADECKGSGGVGCSFDYATIPGDMYSASSTVCGDQKPALRWPTLDSKVNQDAKEDFLIWEFDDELYKQHIDYCIRAHGVSRLRALAESGQPFFLGIGFAKPHMPWVAPKEEFDIYRKVPDHVMEPPPEIQDGTDNLKSDYWNDFDPRTRPESSGELLKYGDARSWSFADRSRGYYASTTFVDKQIGEILKVLDTEVSEAVRRNTMIILWGDHGFHLGDQNTWGKKTILEHATRVPCGVAPPPAFLDANPAIAANVARGDLHTTSPSDSVDILPTILNITGIPLPDTFQGRRGTTAHVIAGTSLVPLMVDPNGYVRSASVSQYESYTDRRMGYSVRTRYHRMIIYLDNGGGGPIRSLSSSSVEIFRYLQPGNYELVNHANDQDFEDVKKALLEVIRNPFNVNGLPDADWTHLYMAKDPKPFDHDMY